MRPGCWPTQARMMIPIRKSDEEGTGQISGATESSCHSPSTWSANLPHVCKRLPRACTSCARSLSEHSDLGPAGCACCQPSNDTNVSAGILPASFPSSVHVHMGVGLRRLSGNATPASDTALAMSTPLGGPPGLSATLCSGHEPGWGSCWNSGCCCCTILIWGSCPSCSRPLTD